MLEKNTNLTKHNKRWSEADDEILKELWDVVNIDTLQKKLQRTKYAIFKRANTLNLKNPIFYNYFSQTQVARILKIDRKTLLNTDIVFIKKKFKNKIFNVITQENLLQWLEKNQDKYYARNIPKYGLGIEPIWLIEKRKNENKNHRQFKRWTTSEIYNLKYMYRTGLPIEKIALELNRTVNSINKRLSLLKIREPKFKCTPWSEKENNRLDYLLKNTLYTLDEIADDIMRSRLSIERKISRNYNSNFTSLRKEILENEISKIHFENQYDSFEDIKISKY